MQFKHDVFISYAWGDNPEDEPWVTRLHEELERRLRAILGRPARIWRDQGEIRGNEAFPVTLADAVRETALILTVISPSYRTSTGYTAKGEKGWCRQELEGFLAGCRETGGLRLGSYTRAFKVIKEPVDLKEHPDEIRQITGYVFHDEGDYPMPWPPTEEKFRVRLNRLATDIACMLKRMGLHQESVAGCSHVEDEEQGESVYLAETTSDLDQEWHQIRSELQDRGFRVLPVDRLDLDGTVEHVEAEIRRQMEHCLFSVHLLGARSAKSPEGSTAGIVSIQGKVAESLGLYRLYWIPKGLTTSDQAQEHFLADVRANAPPSTEGDLLETSLEDLRTAIGRKIDELREPEPVPSGPPASGQALSVYLVHNERDGEQAKRLEAALRESGFDVLTPLFGPLYETMHPQFLRDCDAALLYYGEGSRGWVSRQQSDLLQAGVPGAGLQPRDSEFLAKAIYIAPPAVSDPSDPRLPFLQDALLIREEPEFSPALLSDFVGRLSQKGRNGA